MSASGLLERSRPAGRAPATGRSARPTRLYSYRYFGAFRLFLAGLVVLQHFAADLAPERLADAMMPYPVGSMAVLAFFALSGFVITEAADCVYRDRAAAFLANRLLRIMPHFIVAIALSILAHAAFVLADGTRLWRSQSGFPAEVAFAPRNIALNFLGVMPLSNRLIDYNFLDITWAVRVEMAFYIAIFVGLLLARTRLGARGLGWVLGLLLVLAAPLFVIGVQHDAALLVYTPYFAFGSGLYFAISRSRWGLVVVLSSIPAMLWQYLAHPPVVPLPGAPPMSVWPNLAVLTSLMVALVVLAFVRLPKMQSHDKLLGSWTYPLYLYHEDVLVIVLTATVGYGYGVFIGAMAVSLLYAAVMTGVVDTSVDRYRDRLRGRELALEPLALREGS